MRWTAEWFCVHACCDDTNDDDEQCVVGWQECVWVCVGGRVCPGFRLWQRQLHMHVAQMRSWTRPLGHTAVLVHSAHSPPCMQSVHQASR